MVIKDFISSLNIFYCPICKKKNGTYFNNLCSECYTKLDFIEVENSCYACGGELDGVLAICSKCAKEKKRSFSLALSILKYRNFSREILTAFKLRSTPELAHLLANLVVDRLSKSDIEFELIVPVPLHWSRLLRRKFNQSELIASLVGKKLSIPFSSKALKRVKIGKSQKSLNSRERHKNLRNAFRANSKLVHNKKILLIDDIFTTGATLDNATKILNKANAKEVYVLSIARA